MKIATVASDLKTFGGDLLSSDRGASWTNYMVTRPGKWISLTGSADASVLLKGQYGAGGYVLLSRHCAIFINT